MVSHEYKCIFIHLPKTGGEAIISLFDKHDNNISKHATALQIRDYLGEDTWNEYFKFTIVRNPYDQVISMYSHLRKTKYQKDIILKKYGKTILNPTIACRTALKYKFPKYCDIVFNKRQKQEEEYRIEWPVYHFAPFIDWISDEKGNIIVDYVGRFENFENEIDFIFNKLNRPKIEIPQKNKSKHNHYSTYYSNKAINIIKQHYIKDIQHFNYFFEDKRSFFQKIKNKF